MTQTRITRLFTIIIDINATMSRVLTSITDNSCNRSQARLMARNNFEILCLQSSPGVQQTQTMEMAPTTRLMEIAL